METPSAAGVDRSTVAGPCVGGVDGVAAAVPAPVARVSAARTASAGRAVRVMWGSPRRWRWLMASEMNVGSRRASPG